MRGKIARYVALPAMAASRMDGVRSAVPLVFCLAALVFGSGAVGAAERQPETAGLSRTEVQRAGERIYRDGVLPSGEPLKAIVQGDIPVEGTLFSCSSCHMRGGLGSYEGRVVTLPTNGKRLYQPYYNGSLAELSPQEWESIPSQYRFPILRPAYTDKTLAIALRGGVDPTGRRFDPVMPRYQLEEQDMAILIAYLKELSSAPAPGVTETTLRFATVIAGEVSPADRAAMLVPLEAYFSDRNNQAASFEKRRKSYGWAAGNMDREFRRLSLARWELKGPPETWRAQLEEYYRKEPVFALLGGISYGDWKPVHDFSEEHRIPCIFPITDYPVVSESDWYTLYFSKGLYQEGEAAARFLANSEGLEPDRAVVEIVRESRAGRAVAEGFEKTWQELGRPAPTVAPLKAGESLTPELLRRLVPAGVSPILLVWDGDESLPALESIAADGKRPAMALVSSSLMQRDATTLPDAIRGFTYLTYPYRLPRDEGQYAKFAKAWLESRKAPVNDRRISTRMYSLVSLMAQTLMHLKRNYYRDNLLDVISMFPDQLYPDYERLSFGPGQQYASKGCYIVQVTQGPDPRLVKKSDWVIH